MSLGTMEERTEEMKKQARELIEKAYQRGYKAGQENSLVVDSDKYIEQGRNEAWEAAKKIASYAIPLSIFGLNTRNGGFSSPLNSCETMKASDVIEKIIAYEEKKKQEEEIRVGDEIELNEVKVIVTKTNGKYFDGAGCDGGVYSRRELSLWKKTGRHFPEIAEVLKKMKEN